MYKIAYIDDESYAIDQVKQALGNITWYEFFYFESYQDALGKNFDVIILDYYLDKDQITGDAIVDLLSFRVLVWFSSILKKSQKIVENRPFSYACEKIAFGKNAQLEDIFQLIFLYDLPVSMGLK